MLRTSRQNSAISAYDYNKTPMDIIGTRGIIFNDAETRASFENHGEDCFYVGMAKYHYRLKEFLWHLHVHIARTQSAKLYPTHCKVPTISQSDLTLIAASDLLQEMKILVPTAESKIRHAKILQRLGAILSNNPPKRVDTNAPQRVEQSATSSNSLTSPRVIKGTKLIHQRVTRSNVPMPTIMEVEEPPRDSQMTTRRSKHSSAERRPILPPFALPKRKAKSRKVNGILIGSKRNNIKNASRKRIQTLIEMQNASDRME